MKIEYEGGEGNKLEFFRNLYEEARAYSDAEYEKMERNKKQYLGDDEIDAPPGSNEKPQRAKMVRNITYELIESQNTSYIPTPSVTPKMWSERNERCAKSIETLVKNKRNELPFEKMNDIDERLSPIYGGSVWLIEWDNSILTHNSVGDIRINILSPMRFTGQPGIYTVEDMEYCFICFETTKEDIVRKYGVTLEVAEEAESDENHDDKTATLYVCYYKDENDNVCEFVWSGDKTLLDIENYYARKRYVCKVCGKRKELCSCENPDYELQNEEYEELDRDILLSDGTVIPAMSEVYENGTVVYETRKQQVLEADGTPAFENLNGVMLPLMVDVTVPKLAPTRLPYFTPKTLPVVIRSNTSSEDSLFGQSDCEIIRPQQQAINKIESRILEKLLKSGVYPIVPEDYAGEIDNSIYEKSLKANQSNFNLFGRVDLQCDVSRDINEAERIYDHAKRILGISDSFQGQYDSSAQSGRAKQIQVQQSAGRLDSKRQMKNAAYAGIDRVIFEYYIAYADEPRPAVYRDAQGRIQNAMFSRYDFIERDSAGEYYYNDGYLFSADATTDVEKNREALWAENRQNFASGAYGDPAVPQTKLIFWQNMEKLHYPFARDNVERISEEIARMAEIQAMQEQIAGLETEIGNRAEYENYLMEQINARATGGQV